MLRVRGTGLLARGFGGPVALMLVVGPVGAAAMSDRAAARAARTVAGGLRTLGLTGTSRVILRGHRRLARLRGTGPLGGAPWPAALLLGARQVALTAVGAAVADLPVRHPTLLMLAVAMWAVALPAAHAPAHPGRRGTRT